MFGLTRTLTHAGLLATVLLASIAHAAMQLDRTRLIIPEADGRAVIQAHSDDPAPLLLQVWVEAATDDAVAAPAPATGPAPVPFITDPPMLRLEPGTSRAIQVLRVTPPADLPSERESLYWLNVLEIPASAAADASDPTPNHLYVSLQSRLKIFYRPRALARYGADGHGQTRQGADRLRFALERGDAGQAWLAIHNPAPIHQTLATLTLHRPDAAPMTLDAPMLAPFETQRLALPQTFGVNGTSGARLAFATVNDDGNLIDDEQAL